jgi:hypothetical protein
MRRVSSPVIDWAARGQGPDVVMGRPHAIGHGASAKLAAMTQFARTRIGCAVGLGGAGTRAHNRAGLESGISSICGNDRDVGDAGSRARNPALERNHWGQRVRVEGKGDERQRPCVSDEAAGPSPDKTEPTQSAARRATAIPATSTIPLEIHRVGEPTVQEHCAGG